MNKDFLEELKRPLNQELMAVKNEREMNSVALESAKGSFASELKETMGEDIKSVLQEASVEREVVEEKKKKQGAFSKFLDKIARVCR